MQQYCSNCGVRTETRTVGKHTLRVCPDCETIFFRDPKLVVTALIEHDGQVLLVKRDIDPGRGLWGLPGGYVDWNEHPERAMVRECEEETGAQVQPAGILQVQHVVRGDQGIVILAYRARLVGGEIRARDEVQQVGWFRPEVLPPLAFATHRQILQEWRQEVQARGAA